MWFGTKYCLSDYTPELLSIMSNPNLHYPGIKVGLPPKNTLLPNRLDIEPEETEYSRVPKKIKEWQGDTEVWYKKDDKFKRPKAFINIKIYPHGGLHANLGKTVEGKMFAEIWEAAIKEYLREFKYMAEMASLEFKIKVNEDSFEFEFSGFNDSLFQFLSQALEKIGKFTTTEENEMRDIFNQVKEKML
jgi:insulysin